MLGGSLSDELLALLPVELRDAYDLDRLAVSDLDGQLVWTLVQGVTLVYGDLVGALFEDSILSTWRLLYPPVYPA